MITLRQVKWHFPLGRCSHFQCALIRVDMKSSYFRLQLLVPMAWWEKMVLYPFYLLIWRGEPTKTVTGGLFHVYVLYQQKKRPRRFYSKIFKQYYWDVQSNENDWQLYCNLEVAYCWNQFRSSGNWDSSLYLYLGIDKGDLVRLTSLHIPLSNLNENEIACMDVARACLKRLAGRLTFPIFSL